MYILANHLKSLNDLTLCTLLNVTKQNLDYLIDPLNFTKNGENLILHEMVCHKIKEKM